MAHRLAVALPPDEVDRLVRGLEGTSIPHDEALTDVLGLLYAGLTLDDLDPTARRLLDARLDRCRRCLTWTPVAETFHYADNDDEGVFCEVCVDYLDLETEW